MLAKLVAIGLIFFFILYLVNARGMKEAALAVLLSGETKVDDSDKEEQALRKIIRLYTFGMILLFMGMFAVGVLIVPEFIKIILE